MSTSLFRIAISSFISSFSFSSRELFSCASTSIWRAISRAFFSSVSSSFVSRSFACWLARSSSSSSVMRLWFAVPSPPWLRMISSSCFFFASSSCSGV